MRAVVQRVSHAEVTVGDEVVGAIGRGLCVLLCAMAGDDDSDVQFTARKIASLRIFPDADDRMNLNLLDVGGAVLVVSQFTLAADIASGTRPSFSRAMEPLESKRLLDYACLMLEQAGLKVATGTFGARMQVELTNDGPLTISLDSRRKA
ncbi:MAG: D-aminoacyl-tRNA deacylase [bacterium]|nr:D-aminoacyl-tRNA deacylase [bacterium]